MLLVFTELCLFFKKTFLKNFLGSKQHALWEHDQEERGRQGEQESLVTSQPQNSCHHHYGSKSKPGYQRSGLPGIFSGKLITYSFSGSRSQHQIQYAEIEARRHIGISSVSGSEGSQLKPWRLKIYQIRNDAGSLRFEISTILFVFQFKRFFIVNPHIKKSYNGQTFQSYCYNALRA